MKKQEFLDLLRHYLRYLPPVVIEDIVQDYEEHFLMGCEKGKSEEQICVELGSPQDIADDYLRNEKYKVKSFDGINYSKSETKKGWSLWKLILVGAACLIFAFPLLGLGLGLLGGIFGLITGMVVLIFSMILTAVLLPLTLIPSISLPWFISLPPFLFELHPITKLLFTFSMFSFGVLGLILVISFIKWIFKSIEHLYISIMWKIKKKRGIK